LKLTDEKIDSQDELLFFTNITNLFEIILTRVLILTKQNNCMLNTKYVKSNIQKIGEKATACPKKQVRPILRTSAIFVLIITTTSSILAASFTFGPSNNNNVMAQTQFFSQPVKVHIDKGSYNLGDYVLGIRNLDTNSQFTIFRYTDSIYSPTSVYLDGHMGVHDGDRVQACVMQSSTEKVSCDTEISHYSDSVTDVYVDMNQATTVSNEQGGVDHFQGVSS
jgi:hypothetical protein